MWLAEIFVSPKKTVLDPQGEVIKKTLGSLGYKNIEDVKQGKYFQVVINSPKKPAETIKKICQQLLVNQIIEDYTFKLEKIR
jgi:phosphoribosylformylglycinamidine synthase